MARLFSSLFLAFMLLVGPAICIGGLLEHACDCGQGGAEMQCQHEDSCSDDPCASLTAPSERDARTLLDIEAPWVFLAVVTWNAELAPARWSWSARPSLPPDWSNLPYAQSDRPLLI